MTSIVTARPCVDTAEGDRVPGDMPVAVADAHRCTPDRCNRWLGWQPGRACRAEPADLNVGAVLAKAVDTLVPGRRNNIGGFTMSGWLTHDRRGAVVLARGGSCCGSLRESFSGW